MFVDASAILSILFEEDDHADLTKRMSGADRRVSSVVTLFEVVLGSARELGVDNALIAVQRFVQAADIDVLPIEQTLLPGLAAAHRRYGRGSRHAAKLNMGDCYSYALAKREGLPLLYKGDDFARTDLA
jgi:ribonuclease VapC